MAVKGFDGFDHYNGLADLVARSNFIQWQTHDINGGQPITVSFITGLSGFGKALVFNTQYVGGALVGSTSLRSVFADRNQEAWIGFRFGQQLGRYGLWMAIVDSLGTANNGTQFSIHIDEDNYAIVVYSQDPARGPGSILWASDNNIWMAGVGFYFEMYIKIATSGAGALEFRIDGVSVATVSLTTQQTSNAWFDCIDYWSSPLLNSVARPGNLDDFYYCDNTVGPGLYPANGFLGDVRVATVFATGNDVVQFAPLANTNWQEISEAAMDSDVSYNFDTVAGHQDTFTFQPISSAINTIYGVQLTYATRKDDAGAHTIAGVVKLSGTSYPYGSPNSIPASVTYVYFSDLWILSPASAVNFTLTELNGGTYGYKLVS